ncbi:MAG: DUF4097 family beta strand repeat protein [Polyangiaceae bacterium]|nr:DUF4097 family beta strand repeat protein [Polyangiaceae bacterium]
MNRSLRTACLLLATTFAALPLVGCKVTVEPLTRYEGTPVSESITYTPGKPIHIIGANGQIDVVRGSSDQVEVTFSPFTMDEDTAEDRAVSEMENKLELTAADGSEILIEVGLKDGSSSYLGADIKVAIPSTFDGAFEVDQGNGGVDVDLGGGAPTSTDVQNTGGGGVKVLGARGKLTIEGSAGDVEVSVAEWAAGGENGSVKAGSGDISFTLPASANGTLTVTPNGELTESGIPTDWTSAENEAGKSYTMGSDATGAHVDVSTDLGDIAVIVK